MYYEIWERYDETTSDYDTTLGMPSARRDVMMSSLLREDSFDWSTTIRNKRSNRREVAVEFGKLIW